MSNEVELKLFFKAQDYDSLVKVLDILPQFKPKQTKFLNNSYFDTPELQLRKWDMGLRIRGGGDHKEQTIKTRGQVIGGIHSRPEYNCPILADIPDLALFPRDIWPSNDQVIPVQQALYCLFETNFERKTWLVTQETSQKATQYISRVEIALDRGEIIASGKQEVLCELELELLEGEVSALLRLAYGIAAQVPVRLGRASKAQRGYRLGGKSKAASLDDLHLVTSITSEAGATELTVAELKKVLAVELENWQILDSLLSISDTRESSDISATDVTLHKRITSDLWARLAVSFTQMNHCVEKLHWHTLLEAEYWQLLIKELAETDKLTAQWHSLAYGQSQLALVAALLVNAD
jgi:triphosphatase